MKSVQEINSLEYKPKNDWDTVTIEDQNKLWEGVDEFYRERGYPKMNAVWLADVILRRLRNDRDAWIVTEGNKGYGKSNLSLLLSLLICRNAGLWKNKITGKIIKVLPRLSPLDENEWEHIESGFSFSRNTSFLDSHEEVKQKYYKLDRYSPLNIDEGSKNLHKYNWQSKTQFMLVQLSDTERYQNKACFISIPRFAELNSIFRNDRITMRLFIYDRSSSKNYASVIMSLRDENRHIADPWHTELNARIYTKELNRIPIGGRSPQIILRTEKKLKGYAGNFEIPSLKHIAPRIWKIYMTYKIENAQKELEETDEKEIAWQKKLFTFKNSTYNLINYIKEKFPDVTYKDISIITGLSQGQLNTVRSEMQTITPGN